MKSRSEVKRKPKRKYTGRLARKHTGSGWCDIDTNFPPSIVLAACHKLERESFGEGSDGVRAKTRRNARTLAALLEFTDLRVVDVGKLLDVNRDAAWNLRRKWIDLDEEQRQSWLKVVFARLK
jgi:hypothetical protein